MRRLLLLLALVATPVAAGTPVASVAPTAPTPPADESSVATAPLPAQLQELLEDPLFDKATVGVEVVRAATGDVVWSSGETAELIPASTMKLLTAAVALRELGPTWRFPTWILVDGEVSPEGVLDGNLYIKGQGDPTMVVERMYRLVMDLRLRGITEVKGHVIFDDSYFQDTTLVPGWDNPSDLREGPTYAAPLGALSVNYNIASIILRPGASAGAAAVAQFDTPTPAVVLDNRVTTGSTRSRSSLKMERTLDDSGHVATYTLTGNIPAERDPVTLYRALSDPLTNYIGAFQGVAKASGLKVKGAYKAGTAPASAKVWHRVDSVPLVDVLAQMNKLSNNFIAEQVLRSVGAERYGLPGTTEKGVRAIGEYLTSLGVSPDHYTLANGSGLTRATRFRPSVLNAVLVDMYRDPAMETEFMATLSVGGRDGTLKYRFREDGMGGRVRGKSGTLDGVRCLAGYVEAVDGETYAFTFLVNDIQGAVARAKTAHERMVLTLSGTKSEVADGGEEAEDSP